MPGGTSWQQFDFNDKDAAGNYRVKHFNEGYGYDIEKSLSGLPLKQDGQEALLSKLKQGGKVEAAIIIAGNEHTCFLAANPQKKEVAIYNATGQKVSMDELKGNRNQRKSNNIREMVPSKQQTVQKQKGVKL